MSWSLITDDWRLKLLALGLAILMLGAVAFSENPPTTGSQTIGLNYNVAPNVILINPPPRITVTYSGLADVIKNISPSNLVAIVDATHATPGPADRLNVLVRAPSGVNVSQPAPVAINVDTLQSVDLPVSIVALAAQSWSINPKKTYSACPGAQVSANPCIVQFTGPASWEKNLTAYVTYPSPVVGTIDSPNYTISLKNSNGVLNLGQVQTTPPAGLDVTAASVHIEAVAGSSSSTVPLLDSPPSHGPPAGYRVTAISITPSFVTITGQIAALGLIRSITLPPVDLSGQTSTYTVQVAIPYATAITGNVANASVTYTIAPNPSASPGA